MKLKKQYIDGYVMDSVRIAALIITVFSLINIAHYYMSLREFRETITNTTLMRSTNYISKALTDITDTYAYSSKILAELYAYKIQTDYDVDGMLAELEQTKMSLSVKNIGLVDLNKQLYLDSLGQVLPLQLTSERDLWISEFVNKPEDYRYYLYDPDEAEYDSLYSFFHDHKIRDNNNKIIGIIGVGIEYGTFYDRIQGFDDTINISFLTKNGDIRLPTTQKGQSIYSLFPYLSPQQLPSADDQNQIIWKHVNGKSILLYLKYLKDINRILLLEMDVTKYYNQAKMQHFYSFLLGLVLTIVIVIVNLLINLYQSNKLKQSAFYDSLTDCRNRNFLESHVKKFTYWQQIAKSGYSLLAFDIDHFKNINDNYGHTEGDRVLKQVATIVKNNLRDSDEFIRIGGDEFLVLLDMNTQRAINVAERINQQVSKETRVTLSIGMTDILPEDNFDSAIERADSALYTAKRNGRDQVTVYV